MPKMVKTRCEYSYAILKDQLLLGLYRSSASNQIGFLFFSAPGGICNRAKCGLFPIFLHERHWSVRDFISPLQILFWTTSLSETAFCLWHWHLVSRSGN